MKTGKAKLIYRYLPLGQFEPGTSQGAQATECAADQGAFWPYHDRLFVAAGYGGQAGFVVERLIGYAEELELNRDEFSQCMVSQQHVQTIRDSQQAGGAAGVRSTPSVVINGKLMSNPSDVNALRAEIDSLLAAE